MTSGGGVTGGGSASSGGGSTGADHCLGIYCAPSFVCDPTDGICECDGQACSGNCDADSGACLAACDDDGGGTYPVIGQSPYAVQLPTAYLDKAYNYALQPACGVPPLQWSLVSISAASSFEVIGLYFYPAQGEIEGVPQVASHAGPFEFEIEARDEMGNTGVQNYLLEVIGPEP